MRCRIACLLAAFACSASAGTWIRISSPTVELFTDCSEGAARAVLNRFEVLHRIFRESSIAESPAPVRVFVFASDDEYRKYRPDSNSAGFYQPDQDRDFIVLYQVIALKRNASHEYLHMVINHASAKLPTWLEEGLPEFYSTISLNATRMRIGDAIDSHRSLLATQPWLSADDLALGNPSDGGIFYAESWAMVHMLSLSPPWAGGMPEFVKLLSQGRDQGEAFTAAFGKSMEDAVAALRVYVRNMKETTAAAPPAEEFQISHVTRIAAVDVTLALADLALHSEHPALARSLFLRAAKDDPHSAAAAAGLGALALAENRKADAAREWERAIAMGYRDANTYFQLAMLKNDNALLDKAVAIDPNFAEAHFLLGVRATDSGNFQAAIEHLRQAVAIKPRRSTYWNALGYAQVKSGDRQGGAESARRAAIVASTAQQEQMAADLTRLAAETPLTSHEQKPDVITPASWQKRKGDTRIEGMLIEVNCNSLPVRLLFSVQGKTLGLNVEDPTGVELINTEGISTTLVCGEQSRPVAAEYLAATKEITRIEFRPIVIIKR